MSKELILSENHVLKLILDEFNNNSIGVKFMLSDWFLNPENDGNMLIQRRALRNDRFDIVQSFDESTYALKETHITPMGINSLNGELLTHPIIQDVTYTPQVAFLVSSDNEINVTANRIAIEEVRSRLRQKQKVFNITQYDLEDTSKRLEKTFKGVLTAGEIVYGDIEKFNGRGYMMITLTLDLFISNYGEFANQEEYRFGTSAILGADGKPKMIEIPKILWDYGMALDTAPTQLLLRYAENNDMASEVKSYKTSKGFVISFQVQIDFRNEFLRHVYLESRRVRLNVPTYYIEMWTNYYDENNNYVELPESRVKRAYNLEINRLSSELSLGDKIEFLLNFSPSPDGWFE